MRMNSTVLLQIKHLRVPTTNLILRRAASTTPVANDSKRAEVRPEYPLLDTKFDQHRIAYRYRRTLELLRGYLVYRLFSVNFLVNNQDKVNVEPTRIDFGGERFVSSRFLPLLVVSLVIDCSAAPSSWQHLVISSVGRVPKRSNRWSNDCKPTVSSRSWITAWKATMLVPPLRKIIFERFLKVSHSPRRYLAWRKRSVCMTRTRRSSSSASKRRMTYVEKII